jgi:hypothetical protein
MRLPELAEHKNQQRTHAHEEQIGQKEILIQERGKKK